MESSPNTPRPRNRRSERYEESPQAAAPSPAVPLPRALRSQEPPSAPTQTPPPAAVPVPRALRQNAAASVPAPRALQPRASAPAAAQEPTRPRPAPPVRSAQPAPRPSSRAARPAPQYMDAPRQDASAAPAQEFRMPGWMIGALVGMLILVLALIAAQNLMQAYLKTRADERRAAYEAVLSNHHVLERNGVHTVTFQEDIERYALENNLQPAFVTAIIRNESSFRTNAESSVGARGLMQLMPDTAEWIAGKLDVDNFHFDMMYDAQTNIRFGCWYLGYLSRLFRGDPVLVSAAYHTGQTTVTQWLSDRSMSSDGVTIPLDKLVEGPTKTYAGRVTQAYGIYQTLLYPDRPFQDSVVPVPADDGTASIFADIER